MTLTPIAALFRIFAALIGAFVGAPVLARELETGTSRYTWTQGFGRERWAASKLAQIGVAVTVLAGAFGFLFSWCYEPIIGVRQGLSPLMAITFDLRGVAFAAWALVAFAIGVLAGVLPYRREPGSAKDRRARGRARRIRPDRPGVRPDLGWLLVLSLLLIAAAIWLVRRRAA